MLLPAENRGKIGNIVRKQGPQFHELYRRLVVGLPGVHWGGASGVIRQDVSAKARSAHLKKLPAELLTRVQNNYSRSGCPPPGGDDSAYWVKLAGDERLPAVLREGKVYEIFKVM